MLVLELGEKVSVELDTAASLGHAEELGAHGADAAGLGPLGLDLESGLPVNAQKHTMSAAAMPWNVGTKAGVALGRQMDVLGAGADEGHSFCLDR